MKRQSSSSRSLKWIQRNSLDNVACLEYVKDLCSNIFNFDKFEIIRNENSEMGLRISYKGKEFEIKTNKEDVCLNLYDISDDIRVRSKTVFTGDSCWFSCFEWMGKNIL